jgi:hypothetical protein
MYFKNVWEEDITFFFTQRYEIRQVQSYIGQCSDQWQLSGVCRTQRAGSLCSCQGSGLRTSGSAVISYGDGFFFSQEGERDREAEDYHDDGERKDRTNFEPVGGQHLQGCEGENCCKAVVEEAQLGEEVGQEEVERAEPHDGHDVRGVGQEGVAGDGEDGRDGVEREDDIGEFDGDEGEKEDRDHAAPVFDDEELVLAEADGMEAGEPGNPTGGVDFVFFLGGKNEADGGDEQDGGEGVTDPVEASEETDAGGDKGSAHDDGAGDAPEEGFGLISGFDPEDAEEKEKEEEVVDGEGLFDSVAGEVLRCGLATEDAKYEEGEGESCADPEDGGGDGG